MFKLVKNINDIILNISNNSQVYIKYTCEELNTVILVKCKFIILIDTFCVKKPWKSDEVNLDYKWEPISIIILIPPCQYRILI